MDGERRRRELVGRREQLGLGLCMRRMREVESVFNWGMEPR